jgi:hypothetical protein
MVPIRRSQRVTISLFAALALIFSICQPMGVCACTTESVSAGGVGHGCCGRPVGAAKVKSCCGQTCCDAPGDFAGSAKTFACQCSPPAACDGGDQVGCRCSTHHGDGPVAPTNSSRQGLGHPAVALSMVLFVPTEPHRLVSTISSVPPWVATGNERQAQLQVWRK